LLLVVVRVAYGVSCRARAVTCATPLAPPGRRWAGFAPGRIAPAGWVPRSRPRWAPGTRPVMKSKLAW